MVGHMEVRHRLVESFDHDGCRPVGVQAEARKELAGRVHHRVHRSLIVVPGEFLTVHNVDISEELMGRTERVGE